MIQQRRRRLPLTSLDNLGNSSEGYQEIDREKQRNKGAKRRRTRRRSHITKLRRRAAALTAVLVATVCYTQHNSAVSISGSILTSLNRCLSQWLSPNNSLAPAYLLEHVDIYNAVWQSAYRNQSEFPSYERNPFALVSTYGTEVMNQGCNLTVIFMDPRLATAGTGEAAWFSLESVAAFLPDACVLLQTSSCIVREYLESSQGFVSDEAVMQTIGDHVYDSALPLFRTMIERGRVRISIPNHVKYNLKSCSDYGNPSSALMNVNYWNDEFIEGIDSDHVLFVQEDAVLCHSFDVNHYKDFAFVGSVWSKKSLDLSEGMCHGMPLRWRSWIGPQMRWERQQKRLSSIRADKLLPRPEVLLNTTFPDICSNGLGPVGNGGFSLRKRTWAIKAIEACPHIKYSGINMNQSVFGCKVLETINEDLYFGIVLRGIGAPMPLAWEASLFSTEMLLPGEVKEMYGEEPKDVNSVSQKHRMIRYDDKRVTLSAGLHKPWWYHSTDFLRSPEVEDACPFLQYIFPSKDSDKWKQWQRLRTEEEKQPWHGIGA